MGELKDMLQGVAAAKERGFAGEDFAGGYGRVVTGRVKRRRAATSVGVGGASVLGASALAVGVMNVPWGAMGGGLAPGASQSVVCTTTTPSPDGASGDHTWGSLKPLSDGEQDMASFPDSDVTVRYALGDLVIVDDRTGEVKTVHLLADAGPTVVENGGASVLRQHEDGTYTVPLPGDRVVILRLVPHEPPADAEVITTDYRFPIVEFAVDGPAVPAVTCVTTTPAPSEPEPSATAPSSPVPSPEPSVSATLGQSVGETPFQCGYVLPEEEFGSPALEITTTRWTGQEATDRLAAEDVALEPGLVTSEPVLPVAITSGLDEPLNGVWDGSGVSGYVDPAVSQNAALRDPNAGVSIVTGVTFVAVTNDAIVGLLREQRVGESALVWFAPNDGVAQGLTTVILRMDAADVVEACPGQELGDDWSLYAVAGTTFTYPDGSADPVDYAWAKMTQ